MKKGKFAKKLAAGVVAAALFASALPVYASDSLPWTGSQTHGPNEPTVRGFTAQQLIDWTPKEQPYAELLRSRIPLQPRIEAFTETQANPSLNPDVQMHSLMGDYGNSFMDNPAYTNKFGVYTFNFWQYLDQIAYWHGTATAYEDRELYDPTMEWTERWFEIGFLNIPNPAWTDAAHKNGVLSLGKVFFSDNDRGPITYKQMIVKDENGNFPVAEKMIEIAEYYGFDGYFFNQEEGGRWGQNVAVADVETYRDFLAVLHDSGLYVKWYNSVSDSGGLATGNKAINNASVNWLYDRNNQRQLTDSFFLDYTTSNSSVQSSKTYLEGINEQYGTDFDVYKNAYFGIEAGAYKWNSNRSYANALVNTPMGYPYSSVAMLGADFVHHEVDSDLGHSDQGLADVAWRYSNEHQWRSTARERLWWTGPSIDPTTAGFASSRSALDTAVGANGTNWPGVASFITERSVLGNANFFTSFNTGRGLRWYKNGEVNNTSEWSNISIQDIPVTWQWWQDTTGTPLTVDYDYGEGYALGDANYTYAGYSQLGGYNGGSSLVANGTLDAETFLRLYKTEIALNANHSLELAYNKPAASDTSTIGLGLIFKDDPDTVVTVPLAGGDKTNGWQTVTADLSAYAGKTVAAFGLVFNPGADGSIENWQANFGSLTISDGSATVPTAPSGLAIQEAFEGTDEMYLEWNLDHSFDEVKQYNIYVNDTFVGAKYDEVYYIKNLPAQSGTISVVPVGADGKEGAAASIAFNLAGAGVSDLTATSYDDGELVVNWKGAGASGNVTVEVETRWHLMGEPVTQSVTVPARSGAASFTGMPVNGDNFIVRLKKDGQQPLSLTGAFIDVEIEPYAGEYTWNGNTLKLDMATTRDWRRMVIYEDGVAKQFQVTYHWNNREGIIRGRSTIPSLQFSSNAKYVTIVMEDYAGNFSEPVYLRAPAVDEDMFPDAVLRQWVLDNVGDSGVDVLNYTGELALGGLDIADFTGLSYFEKATVLSAAGNRNVVALADLNAPAGIQNLNIGGTAIEAVTAKELATLPALETLNITGMAQLKLLDLSGSNIGSLVTGDAGALEALFYLDLRGSALDVAENAPARVFADWVDLNKTDRTKSYPVAFEGNFALNAPVSGEPAGLQNITDGDRSTYAGLNQGNQFTVDLGAPTKLDNIVANFTDYYYYATGITYEGSADGETWETLGTATASWQSSSTLALNGEKTARYLRATIDGTGYYGAARLTELEANGSQLFDYRSAVYYDGQTEPDPAPLVALVNTLSGYRKDDYTPSTWAPVPAALSAAKQALEYTDPTITKREIAQHTATLTQVLEGLVLSGSAQALNDWAELVWSWYENSADQYSAASWNALVDAIQNAIDLAAEKGEELPLTEYEAAIDAINAAIDGLVKQNKAALADWIAIADALLAEAEGSGEYFESAVARLTEVLERADALMADDAASQESIDAMVKELQSAVEQMLQHGNRRSLETLVQLAGNLQEADYRSDGWPAFTGALSAASELLGKTEVTQDQLDEAYANLFNAMKALELRAEFAELEKAIAMAKEIFAKAELYTPASIEGLNAEVAAAEAVYANGQASQAEVDAARSALNAKIGEARLKAKKEGLRSAMMSVRSLNFSLYTPETVAAVEAVLATADDVDANENASQNDVDNTLKDLLAAVNALKEKAKEVVEKPNTDTPPANNGDNTTPNNEERRSVTINPRARYTPATPEAAPAAPTTPEAEAQPDAADTNLTPPAAEGNNGSAEVTLPDEQAPAAAPAAPVAPQPDGSSLNPVLIIVPVGLLLAAGVVVAVVLYRKKAKAKAQAKPEDK